MSWRTKKILLLVESYIFYAAWNPPFVILLWVSTALDWVVARRIHIAGTTTSRRGWLAVSLLVNLGILGYFKYGEFLLQNWVALAATAGVEWQPPAWNIVLPVGISFYTFQTMAYSLDVYLRRAEPSKSLLDFSLFVTFFPQLVAGPIVRPADLIPQFAVEPARRAGQVAWGLSLMVLGMFQKIVIADGALAPASDAVFGSTEVLHWTDAWLGTLAFSGQIFCDFAGYSTTAIGAALALGFGLPDNFRYPYAAVGFSDFWQRWHISLSTWLRDYLYVPLGGNRKGPARTYVNLMVTMLLGGLWHGASWTFVVWGGLHGLYLSVERFLQRRVGPTPLSQSLPFQMALAALTYFLVNLTWVFFRAREFDREIPAIRWPAVMVLAFVIFGATLGAWEAHWRAEWFVPSYRNSDGLWAVTRDRIDTDAGRGVTIVGSSRVLFDINLETWHAVTGVLPIQLALEGTSPRPYLRHVAQETDFAGLVVVGVTDGLFFGPDAGLRGDVLKKFKERSPADRASQWVSMHLVEPVLAFYDPDIALFTILRRQAIWPDRAGMTRPRPEVRKLANLQATRQADMWTKASDHESYPEVTRNIWRAFLSAPRPAPPPPDVMQKHMTSLFESVAADVSAIRARGGDVVFVRAPSTGPFREAERKGFTREHSWDPLLASSGAAGIHFEDHADLQDFELPEWSHIRADQTDRFTRSLLTHIRNALSARGTPRQEVGR